MGVTSFLYKANGLSFASPANTINSIPSKINTAQNIYYNIIAPYFMNSYFNK